MDVGGTQDEPEGQTWENTHRRQFQRFLLEFDSSGEGVPGKYEREARAALQAGVNTLQVDVRDILAWGGDYLAEFIQQQYLNLIGELSLVLREFMQEVVARAETADEAQPVVGTFHCYINNPDKIESVRTLRCERLGELQGLKGTVTRTSDVRPELKEAAFECEICHGVIRGVEQQFRFTPPAVCPNEGCQNRTLFILRPEASTFNDWQKLRLQENASEIPAGSMPRTIDVIVRDDICDRCKAGDKVVLTGCLAAVPDVPALMKPGEVPRTVTQEKSRNTRTEFGLVDNAVQGLKALGVRDLGYKITFLATAVKVTNEAKSAGPSDVMDGAPTAFNSLTVTLQEKIRRIVSSGNCLSLLAKTFAPEIYGHEEIKKGILFMLVGGVEKATEKEGIKLRGDINICIVGDPGTAKSRLLKYVQNFAGRTVLTSGKTSTAAGLTASVHRDHDQSNDPVIEAGALMLADQGICCIDEFDKMDDKDMVSIHEAMEQQTISITKAGIQATLNARASVLAACNPISGRYDPSKSFRQNVRLSAPILSRFDLCFVMVDDTDNDAIIAKHISKLHADPLDFAKQQLEQTRDTLTREELQQYLSLAREMRPRLTPAAKETLVHTYVALRQSELQPGQQKNQRMTVRQLESLIRLSEALAKLNFCDVDTVHVEEARHVFANSLSKIRKGQVDLGLDDEEEAPSQQEMATETHHQPILVDATEFERIAAAVVDYLRAVEVQQQADGVADGWVIKENLITWVLDSQLILESETQLIEGYRMVARIINRMISRDLTLIEETREIQGPENQPEMESFVRLHPNFASAVYSVVQGAATGRRREAAQTGAHATLSNEYYSGQSAEVFAAAEGAAEGVLVEQHPFLNDDVFQSYLDESHD